MTKGHKDTMPSATTSVAIERASPQIRADLGYALVAIGSTALWSVVGGWLLYFYLPPEGAGSARVPAAFLSGVMLTVRAVNALVAIPIGAVSDRTQTRWGRRIPWMALSALPLVMFFTLLWRPPVPGMSTWNLVYLAITLLLYNLAYTLNQIPYTALLPEIAQTDHHRVRLSAWSSGAFVVGMILGGCAGPLINRFGYSGAAVAYGAVALPMFYVPLLVLREHPRPGRALKLNARPEDRPMREGLHLMVRNRPFRVMTAAGLCYWGVTTIIQAVMPFLVTELCLLPASETFAFYVPALAASLICYPLVTWLVQRWGKWRVFAASLLASALVLPGLMLIGRFSLSLKAQGLIWVTVQAVAMAGVTMLPPAFGAEIIDADEAMTGQRREGLYYATWGLLDQLTQGATAALLPLILLLGRSHSDPRGPLGVRLVGLLGGILMFLAFVIFLNYPLRSSHPEGTDSAVPRSEGGSPLHV